MKTVSKKKPVMARHRRVPGTPLTAKQRKNIDELAARPDRAVDTSDIPELPPGASIDAGSITVTDVQPYAPQ